MVKSENRQVCLTGPIESLKDQNQKAENTIQNIKQQAEKRSKYDFGTLAISMIVTAILAGGGVYYLAKDRLSKANFGSSINLIRQDTNGNWCKLAGAQIVESNADQEWFCAVKMNSFEE